VDRFPEADRIWHAENDSIILLTCSDYKEFRKIIAKADALGIGHADFREPDIGYQVTASAMCPSAATAKLLKHCQLLGGPTPRPEEPRSLLDYKHLMKATPQGKSNVWQHGKDCCDMLDRILGGEKLPRMDKISWLKDAIEQFPQELSQDIYTYLLFHDIGKTTTHDGQGHYPGHAAESARIWRQIDGRDNIARWMESDMVMHSGSREEAYVLQDRHILRLTALTECYSNAEMFGGFESDSFKIKLKKLIRNGA
jgi:hypothetical protein